MTELTESTQNFLKHLHRFDLAALIAPCEPEIFSRTTNNGFFDEVEIIAHVKAPPPVDEALKCLAAVDRKRIAEAIASGFPSVSTPNDISVETIVGRRADGATAVLADLVIHRAMMIDVATGGRTIQDVNDYYIARQARLAAALPDKDIYRNDHSDLWQWYRYWKDNLPQYSDRRTYIRELLAPAFQALTTISASVVPQREPTGWARVDRALSKARSQIGTASAEEDFQAIGLLCRETIISLAQAVYDPAVHESLDGVKPSVTDANRQLEAYVAHVFRGDSNKEVRVHHRASLALALNLQHRRTATKQLAELCLEATSSTVAVVAIIARPGSTVRPAFNENLDSSI